MVPLMSIVFMCITIVFVLLIAVIIPLIMRKKWRVDAAPYFIGYVVFFVFALILEATLNNVVVQLTGSAITDNIWLYAAYGGLAAGIFEETGRFIAIKFILKKQQSYPHNALMYGAGHGCGEAVLLIGMAMVNNIIYSVMINMGQMNSIIAELPADQQALMQTVITQLTDSPSYIFILSLIERFAAIIMHISFSVIVWTAVVKKKTVFFPFAVILHALVDALILIIQKNISNLVLTEVIVYAFAGVTAFIAYFIWKKYLKGMEPAISENKTAESPLNENKSE